MVEAFAVVAIVIAPTVAGSGEVSTLAEVARELVGSRLLYGFRKYRLIPNVFAWRAK